ncbi:MAG: sulfatase-like hydrolase/transferase [Victivallales bacterium]|nr:sulfatase-like hydrolase/transferase [Victivallales bacterium]
MTEPISKLPNILFLFPDQWRSDWLGCNTELPLLTPNIDRLAAAGITFTNAFTPSPICAPARACLAAGRDYGRCGVKNNSEALPLDMPTFYQSLRDAGYEVCGVGKFDLDKPTLEWGIDGSSHLREWGFTSGIDNEGKFDGSTSYTKNNGDPRGPYLKFLHDRGKADAYCREHQCEERMRTCRDAYITCLDDEEYCDNWLSDNGRSFLKSFPAGRPWFLQVNFTGPHNPMEITRNMAEKWDGVAFPPPVDNDNPAYTPEDHQRNRRHYAAMIENIDRQVGEFLEIVARRGEMENTVVVFASDHGEMLGDHGRWGKSCWFNPSVRIPMIIAAPGVVAGTVSNALVSLQDLAATFTDYARSRTPDGMDAVSLRPAIEGRTGKIRQSVNSGLDGWRMLFDGHFKMITGTSGGPLLYDLQNDPHEMANIAQKNPEKVMEMKMMMSKNQHTEST